MTMPRRRSCSVWLVRLTLPALSALSCQAFVGIDDFTPKARLDSPCEPLPSVKEDAAGLSLMSRIDLPTSTCFWIDRQEVSVAEYTRWQAAVSSGSVSWDPTWCGWKTTRSDPINDAADACAAQVLPLDLQPFAPSKPMRCVDFCEAEAFCRWSGKHLCHATDTLGVQGPRGAVREWMTACTNGFTSVYPWGNDAGEPGRCNTEQATSGCITSRAVCGALPPGEKSSCTTPGGVADLLGNVAEWVFSCNLVDPSQASAPTGCMTLGGGYDSGLSACNVERIIENDTRSPSLGFRCCDDLTLDEALQLSKH